MRRPRTEPCTDVDPDDSGGDGGGGGGPASQGEHARGHGPARCRLPGSPTAPHLAREFVRERACPEHLADPADAVLLVSELVTNALVHGAGPIVLTIRCVRRRAVIAVTDGGARVPVIPAKAPGAGSLAGRGLWMLVALADDWGVRVDAASKTIWFAMTDPSVDGALEPCVPTGHPTSRTPEEAVGSARSRAPSA